MMPSLIFVLVAIIAMILIGWHHDRRVSAEELELKQSAIDRLAQENAELSAQLHDAGAELACHQEWLAESSERAEEYRLKLESALALLAKYQRSRSKDGRFVAK